MKQHLAYGMVAQVLKKQKLAEDGVQPTYVEPNHRAQLLYTEEDRALMEEAWELTTAHRNELAGRPAAQSSSGEGPSVLELLRNT